MANLRFSRASNTRKELVEAQRKKLRRIYTQAAKETRDRIEAMHFKDDQLASTGITKMRLAQLEQELNKSYEGIADRVEDITRTNMQDVTVAVSTDLAKSLSKISGYNFVVRYANVNTDVVDKIALGKIYEGDWTLSKAIWGDTKGIQSEISEIIAVGVAQNKSAYEIAKDLEAYVMPGSEKPWNWGKVYPGCRRVIDYNAQRLARTMVSHAYQLSIIESARSSPFSGKIKWLSAHTDRTCEICEQRDGQIYDCDKVPMDHPNGMCDFEIVFTESLMDISNRLADWVNGASDPDLDKYLQTMGVTLR